MKTATLPLSLSNKGRGVFRIEINRDRLERVVDSLGLFTRGFIESLDRAEEDVRRGRTRSVKSLRSLR